MVKLKNRFGMYQSELTELWIITDAKKKVTFSGIDDKYNCQRIVDLLNQLHLEKEVILEKYNGQSVEYEGLEEQVERLLDFKDKVFDSLNGKIRRGEQAVEWGEQIGADVGAMGFHIELLKQFRKELQE